jgi:hypothetical protein
MDNPAVFNAYNTASFAQAMSYFLNKSLVNNQQSMKVPNHLPAHFDC